MTVSTSAVQLTQNFGPGPQRGTSIYIAVPLACMGLFATVMSHGVFYDVSSTFLGNRELYESIWPLFIAYAVALLISIPLTSHLINRFGPRIPVFMGLLGLALALFILASRSVDFFLFIGSFFLGASTAVAWAGNMALITQWLTPKNYGFALGIVMTAVLLSFFSGPSLLFYLLFSYGFDSSILIVLGILILLAIIELILIKPIPRYFAPLPNAISVMRMRGTWVLLLYTFVGATLLATIYSFGSMFLTSLAFHPFSSYGGFYEILFLLVILLSPLVGFLIRTPSPRVSVFIAAVSGAVGLLHFLYPGFLGNTYEVVFFIEVSAVLFLVPTLIALGRQGARLTPPAFGSVFMLHAFAFALGIFAGSFLSSNIRSYTENYRTLVLAFICVVLATIPLLWFMPSKLEVSETSAENMAEAHSPDTQPPSF